MVGGVEEDDEEDGKGEGKSGSFAGRERLSRCV